MEIVTLLSKEFAKCVLMSSAIAWPMAYFNMDKRLPYFAYRTGIGVGVFLGAVGLALGTALLTVSLQTVKAAVTKPVDSLRYE